MIFLIGRIFRALPDFKGKKRVAKFIFALPFFRNERDIRFKGRFETHFLLPNLKEDVASELFINGIYENDTIDFFTKTIESGGYFIDLGANIGAISIPLKKIRPDLNCICVEASPWIFQYLERNIELNVQENSIIKLNKAIYDISDLKLQFYGPKELFGKGSLNAIFTQDAQETITITLDRLISDFQLPKVNMIKIDIEGYEFFAFKGGSLLLNREQSPDILFEFVDWAEELAGLAKGAAQNCLLESGYKLYLFSTGGKLSYLEKILTNGSAMIFATKRKINQ